MIQSASTSALRAEYLRRLADKPYFAANLGTHLNLFGQHPASGWVMQQQEPERIPFFWRSL